MSNKDEILKEYRDISERLNVLRQKEAPIKPTEKKETEIFFPQFNGEMNNLLSKRAQLSMVLAAIEASED